MYQQTHISNTIFACDKLIKRPPIQRDTLLSEFGASENPLINTSCEIERRITIGFGESRDGNGIEWWREENDWRGKKGGRLTGSDIAV